MLERVRGYVPEAGEEDLTGREELTGRRCCGRAGGAGRGSMVEPAALAALSSSAAHGYDLRRTISEITGGAVVVDAGGLYRTLRRMEEEGLVTSRWAEGDSGPQRREYELTEDGRRLAAHWVGHLRQRERLTGALADALEAGLDESARQTGGES